MTAGSRFWWRALDAPAPRQPRVAASHPTSPAWQIPQRRKPASHGLSLEVPKADRRPLPSHLRARWRLGRTGHIISFALIAIVLAGASLIAAAAVDRSRLEAVALLRLQDGLLALGFGIDQVGLSGHHFTPDHDVYTALELDKGRTFASFDATAALKRIEALPWVETAQITRVFPGALKVEVHERTPTAVWIRKGKSYLIDSSGRVLGAINEPHGWQLPRVAGEGAGAEASLLIETVARYRNIQGQLEIAERVGERRWALRLKNGTRIELGADREVEGLEQISRSGALRGALTGKAYVVDVRTPGRPVMRPALADTSRISDPLSAQMSLAGGAE